MSRALWFMLLWLILPAAAAPAGRIVSLAPHTTEMAAALGLTEQLVGVSERSDYPSEVANLPTVAGYTGIDVEQVMALKPDLVLGWRGGNPPQALAQLRQFGVPLFLSDAGTPEEIIDELLELGRLTARQAEAQQLAAALRQRLAALNLRYGRMPSRPKVFYELWRQPLMTAGKPGWLTPLLARCGADNLFADIDLPYPQVELEIVLQRNPDVIIVGDYDRDYWLHWPQLAAVQSARVHQVAPDLLQRMGPRLIDGLEALCALIWQDQPPPHP